MCPYCKRSFYYDLTSLKVDKGPVCHSEFANISVSRWPKWLECEFTDRKVRGSNPTSATRLPLSRLGQPGSIPALVLPSGGMAARHRKGATAERFLSFFLSSSINHSCPTDREDNVVFSFVGVP
ncbi:hypothetical protein T265_06730 [Opisthorchis viverrini]|uniref:Uncharacterized protein n=1 Tax=Opisthorchis viverrini TaxID=6198 RepID=A0A074ZF61_OPIVI|nr:hypothetical protein T265_06730 [Opisthorchis viverrini]KER25926.1 hypothetical protein T265_06730 [Opisthorchis viverrini]